MTKVKICGITNLEDALLATRFGADMLGFNFYERSPRFIPPERAAAIIRELPKEVATVGVFVNENIQTVRDTSEKLGLNAVQLHGDEPPDYIDAIDSIDVIKAFRLEDGFDEKQLDEFDADYILVDAFSATEYGGTGETCDWQISKQVSVRFPKMLLSGGLSAENVREAIEIIRPYGVDACSKLEIEKGRKDPVKLQRFIAAAKGVK